MTVRLSHFYLLILVLLLTNCRGEYEVIPSHPSEETGGNHYDDGSKDFGNLLGFYLLNEGNMGTNNATLDYIDLHKGKYHRNIYAEANPNIVKELGDVGNDVKIYGSKLYVVVNVSNYIEVMDAKTRKHLGSISIPNVRYVTFHEGKVYASAYVAPVQFDPNARVGNVSEIDTATLQVVRQCNVGYQPEELVVYKDRLYVANSGGYMFPDYDNTLSIVDLKTFTEIKKIPIAINLHRVRLTPYDEIVVSSRGDYGDTPSSLYFFDPKSEKVIKKLDIPVSNFDISGDLAYVYSVSYNNEERTKTISFSIFNVRTKEVLPWQFITDGTQKNIKLPYGIKVNPVNGDIYVTDARDYVSPGYLHCYSKKGKLKWTFRTGQIPGHIAFLYR